MENYVLELGVLCISRLTCHDQFYLVTTYMLESLQLHHMQIQHRFFLLFITNLG